MAVKPSVDPPSPKTLTKRALAGLKAPAREPEASASPDDLKPMPRSLHTPFNHHNTFTEHIQPVIGGMIFLLALPYLAVQIVLCMSWDYLDRKTVNFVALCSRWSRWPVFDTFVKHKGDGFIFTTAIWLSCVPLLCIHEAFHAQAHGFSFLRAAVYNLIRIGPAYANFALSYTLAHKEGHSHNSIFSRPLNSMGAGKLFNWWTGLFFGVLPGTFTHSHVYNHHRYDNGVEDLYSTGGWRRDSLWSFCRYIVTWFGYASNFSTVYQFVSEKRYFWAAQVVAATGYYLALVGVLWTINPAWALASIVWAFIEGNILLSLVNWVWHAFIDPTDPENEFTSSTTIVDGEHFIFSEEYHVVHHSFAGRHWARYPETYQKDADEGRYKRSIRFEKCNIFVLGGSFIAQDYKAMLQFVHDPDGDWKGKDVEEMLKARLRHTTW
jgi:uncharacterized membrane protein